MPKIITSLVSIIDLGIESVTIHGLVQDMAWIIQEDDREMVYIRLWPSTSGDDKVWLPCKLDYMGQTRIGRDEESLKTETSDV